MSRISVRIAFLLLVASAPHVSAQEPATARVPRSHMHTVVEKTFLRIDVLALDICVDSATAVRIAVLASGRRTRALEDSVTRAVLEAPGVTGRLRFLRNVSYAQFLGGMMDEQKHAVDAGLLADSVRRNVSASLPEWFSFLENRDVRKDEQLVYRISGDSLRTTWIDPAGEHLLDRVDTGVWPRTSVLATWYAPGSAFRKGLMESLWSPDARAGACEPLEPGNR